nr:immunoglobulin light chain junction region [Macaca mulatta]MOY05237.1 immunoglobulin light chain junction region [Macaca mulatta]MOY05730.1 immunoglobulin light chain junction region [Macaca mulatta]MOY06142.1 immunoglobulin light chain junction region [Macaca mulatta]MOY06269.1 immunoglobulin light chain junction region [Macaca mulatta]
DYYCLIWHDNAWVF